MSPDGFGPFGAQVHAVRLRKKTEFCSLPMILPANSKFNLDVAMQMGTHLTKMLKSTFLEFYLIL